MSFRVWFRQWVMSFLRLMTVGAQKRKSDAQRKKERERRLKAKYSSANKYRTKKKYHRRRSSLQVQNERAIGALFKFMAYSLSIILLPYGLFDWGHKSVKSRKASKGGGSKKTISHSSVKNNAPSASTKISESKKKEITPRKTAPTVKTTEPTSTEAKTLSASAYSYSQISAFEETKVASKAVAPEPTVDPDDNTPKSTPKNEKDQYIRKRMIVAGSYYCDKAVLDSLDVGSLIDLEAETDNPYDKDAVKLLYKGQKIGYIAKQDKSAYVSCLKLKRNIYGVITAIKEENGQNKYEYETWFDSQK